MVWDADCPELEIVHVNEAPGVLESSAYLLEFDSVHGRWQAGKVESSDADNTMTIDGKVITYSMHTQVTVPAVAWSWRTRVREVDGLTSLTLLELTYRETRACWTGWASLMVGEWSLSVADHGLI
jgi:hypothetical protein